MNSFNRTRRLLKKRDYEYVFANAKKRITSEFSVFYCKNSLVLSRLGIILQKKIVPKAHDRNRIKRLLRETFRVKKLPPIDIVILMRKSAVDLKNEEIINKLDEIWAILGKF